MNGVYESVLHLSLKKQPFDVMVIGRKKLEFRKPSHWMATRITKKRLTRFTHIHFVNGYGPDKPYFVCEYRGYWQSKKRYTCRYPGGLTVEVEPGDYIILCGKIVESGNLN